MACVCKTAICNCWRLPWLQLWLYLFLLYGRLNHKSVDHPCWHEPRIDTSAWSDCEWQARIIDSSYKWKIKSYQNSFINNFLLLREVLLLGECISSAPSSRLHCHLFQLPNIQLPWPIIYEAKIFVSSAHKGEGHCWWPIRPSPHRSTLSVSHSARDSRLRPRFIIPTTQKSHHSSK